MTDPLWVAPGLQNFPPLESGVLADVAVIGGGFSGLGAAVAASELGASVVVVESRSVASGASGRNAGFILSGPAMGFSASVSAVGLQETLDIWDLTRRNHELLCSVIQRHEIDCGYLRRGSMSLAASESEWSELRRECERVSAAGLPACVVPCRSLPQPFDEMYRGGVYHAGNAELDPGAFLRGLARRLPDAVTVFEASPVRRIDTSGPVRIETSAGVVTAERLIVATNAHTRSLMKAMPIAPTRGQVASTNRVGSVVVPFPMYADRGFQYWRQTPDGRLVVGGWRDRDMSAEVGHEETLNAVIHRELTGFVARVAPDARVERRWAGIMGFTPDHFPLVGTVPGMDSSYVAAGYSGHGVAMAFLCGSLVARSALGEQVDIPRAFSPGRFQEPSP